MKTYPSIPRYMPCISFPADVFCKYDGSNIRVEFSRKRGWYKFGTRHRLFDKSDRTFGTVIKLFKDTVADDLEATLRKEWPGAQSFLVFCEYFGRHSFAGQHIDGEAKELKLFDVNPYQQGLISPKDFIRIFKEKPYTAHHLGTHIIDEEYVEGIRQQESIYDYHYEGVIVKWGKRHNLQMLKIKTLRYLSDLKTRFGEEWEKYE